MGNKESTWSGLYGYCIIVVLGIAPNMPGNGVVSVYSSKLLEHCGKVLYKVINKGRKQEVVNEYCY